MRSKITPDAVCDGRQYILGRPAITLAWREAVATGDALVWVIPAQKTG